MDEETFWNLVGRITIAQSIGVELQIIHNQLIVSCTEETFFLAWHCAILLNKGS
jgi:hypothetical protein